MNKMNKKLLKTALEMVNAQNEVILKSLSDDSKAEEIEQERIADNAGEHEAEQKASDVVDLKINDWKEGFGFNPK
jgi:hypothetical protein